MVGVNGEAVHVMPLSAIVDALSVTVRVMLPDEHVPPVPEPFAQTLNVVAGPL
jgi:hypothetical protein